MSAAQNHRTALNAALSYMRSFTLNEVEKQKQKKPRLGGRLKRNSATFSPREAHKSHKNTMQ